MSDVLVKVDGVSKKFCKSLKRSMVYGLQEVSKNLLGISPRTDVLKHKEFWALDHVSFELKRGECLGLIGANGSGKSTLLKILNGIISPDTGRVTVKGRVGALIELGAGFHPMLTGRENIYVNGSILGLSKKKIDYRLDRILEFAELGDFIDTPIKYYSSGMRVRLGFAIAVQTEPDVLLIDEVLAVGDMGFSMKCINSIDQIMNNAAVIFVSHNMPFVSRLSTRLLVMEKGRPVYNDIDIAEGINLYFSKFKSPIPTFTGVGEAEILDVRFDSSTRRHSGKQLFTIDYLDDFHIEIDLKVDRKHKNPRINLIIYDKQMRNVAECFMRNGNNIVDNKNGFISIRVTIPQFNMTQGVYTLTVVVSDNYGKAVLLRHQSVKEFLVISDLMGWSPIQFRGSWQQLN